MASRKHSKQATPHGFSGQTWVVDRFLEDVAKDIKGYLGQSMEEHTKEVTRMHPTFKNFADHLSQTVQEKNVCEKYVNNTGKLCVPDDNLTGQ